MERGDEALGSLNNQHFVSLISNRRSRLIANGVWQRDSIDPDNAFNQKIVNAISPNPLSPFPEAGKGERVTRFFELPGALEGKYLILFL
jgi:hypothetical protein